MKKMKTIKVLVERSEKNYAAHSGEIPTVIATGSTPEEIEQNYLEAVRIYADEMEREGFKLPKSVVSGKFNLVYQYSTDALLAQYAGILTKSALERLTGINQKQLGHYFTGHKKPRAEQKRKIEEGLHKLGRQLLAIEII